MKPQESRSFGRYTILRSIGRGGAATVYLALPPDAAGQVALKVFEPVRTAGSPVDGRFDREIQLLRTVRHRNVVRILDAGHENGLAYLSMEYLGETSLRSRLGSGPLTTEELLSFGSQLVDALEAIHAAGILHRDLNPSNILLDGHRLVVVDFGLARFLDEATLTRSRGVQMTLSYSTPEKLQGGIHSGRSDIYQLGLVLYEMATGRRPFEAENPSLIATAHLTRPPPPVGDAVPGLPRSMDPFLGKMLRKEPEDRYADVPELKEDWRFLANALRTSIRRSPPRGS